MSSLLEAIRDDTREYIALCAKAGEAVHYTFQEGVRVVDVYGEHADRLRGNVGRELRREQTGD